MIVISKEDWEKKSSDFKGEWTRNVWEFRGRDFPEEWIGRKTMLYYDNGTVLLTEGIGFIIQ